MRFKLDECLDIRLAAIFTNAGYDARTVFDQQLKGAIDETIYSVCVNEQRVLVTQDMDFSNPFRFSPLSTPGIIVLKNPSQLLPNAQILIGQIVLKVKEENPKGHLWVVDNKGIRIWPAE